MKPFNYAVTDTTIILYWEKTQMQGGGQSLCYQVYVGGEPAGSTGKTHFTIENLKLDTEYETAVYVAGEAPDRQAAVNVQTASGEQAVSGGKPAFGKPLASCRIRTAKRKRRLDITKPPYLAVGDGKTLNTKAIQQALEDCNEETAVYVPPGTFLTGALRLHDNTELYLEEGAVIQGTANPADYLPRIPSRFEGLEMECCSSLLNMGKLDHTKEPDCENILIHGKGTIASGGRTLAEAVISAEKERLTDFLAGLSEEQKKEYEKPETIPGRVRPRLINISNCKNVRISGLALENGASWNVHMIYSRDILTDNCTFFSKDVWNGDGWNPDSSENCTIFGCVFRTGDDSIAIKSGKNPEGNVIGRPCRGIRIFDCVCEAGHGITIGSEMSGGVSDVKIWDCDLRGGCYGLEVKGTKKRGGYVRDVQVRDSVLPRILFHAVDYNDDGAGAGKPPVFESCRFENVRVLGRYADRDSGEVKDCAGIELKGFDEPGYEIRDILLKNVRLSGGGRTCRIVMENCKEVRFEDVRVEEDRII